VLWQTDVRTHPPLLVMFPPRTSKGRTSDSHLGADGVWESGSDSDEARDAIHPRTQRSRVTLSTVLSAQKHSPPSRRVPAPPLPSPSLRRHMSTESVRTDAEDERWLSVRDLLQGSSPYVLLDGARMSVYSPSRKASFTSSVSPSTALAAAAVVTAATNESATMGVYAGEKSGGAKGSMTQRLPNPTMNFDLRTLKLHLAVRSTEVLACAEAMWEWVLEYQRLRQERLQRLRARARSGSVDGLRARVQGLGSIGPGSIPQVPADSVLDAIAELTRADFDGLLSKFDQ
jgi:hypothetical protein